MVLRILTNIRPPFFKVTLRISKLKKKKNVPKKVEKKAILILNDYM